VEGRRPTRPEGRCIPRLQARRISTPRSPAGYYALRDATHWDQDVFNPFDGKFRVRVIMPQCGSVLAPGRRVFPNVLPVNGSRRLHAFRAAKAECNAPPVVWDTAFHFSPLTPQSLRHRVRRYPTRLHHTPFPCPDPAPIFEGQQADAHDDELAGYKGEQRSKRLIHESV